MPRRRRRRWLLIAAGALAGLALGWAAASMVSRAGSSADGPGVESSSQQ